MLYFILRPLTRFALKAYFRRITINGLENLPLDSPVLLCSNHPTGFIEPCLLACFLPRTLHFLVRGDLFEKPVLSKILISTNQIPIYRFRDGYGKLRNNRKVMNISYEKLAEGKAILIFPEASTTEVKHLRPVKKGAARMALETLELQSDKNLTIVPIGINYSGPNRWRSYVNINIGDPIHPEVVEDQKEMPRAIKDLTVTIEKKLSDLLLVLNDNVAQESLNTVLDLGQWDIPVKTGLRVKHNEPEKFIQERDLSLKLNEDVDFDGVEEARPDLHKFDPKPVSFGELLFGALIFIPVCLFLLLNALPVIIGIKIRNKYVRENEFIASIAIAASLGAYMILFTLIFIILLFVVGWWAFLMFLLPYLGLIGLKGRDYLKNIQYRLKLKSKLGQSKMSKIYDNGIRIVQKIQQNSL